MTIVEAPAVTRSISGRSHNARFAALWAAGLAATALVGTTACMPLLRADTLAFGSVTGWFSSPWAVDHEIVAPTAVADSPHSQQLVDATGGTAATLKEVRERAGLTWDQIARLFGVSRRAVHLWAAGGRMTAANEETLMRVADVLHATAQTPEHEARRAILGLLEGNRQARGSNDEDINRPASTWSAHRGGNGQL